MWELYLPTCKICTRNYIHLNILCRELPPDHHPSGAMGYSMPPEFIKPLAWGIIDTVHQNALRTDCPTCHGKLAGEAMGHRGYKSNTLMNSVNTIYQSSTLMNSVNTICRSNSDTNYAKAEVRIVGIITSHRSKEQATLNKLVQD